MSQKVVGFNAKRELNFHAKSMHKRVIAHRCSYCPYSTFYTTKLRQHLMEEQHFVKRARRPQESHSLEWNLKRGIHWQFKMLYFKRE